MTPISLTQAQITALEHIEDGMDIRNEATIETLLAIHVLHPELLTLKPSRGISKLRAERFTMTAELTLQGRQALLAAAAQRILGKTHGHEIPDVETNIAQGDIILGDGSI